MKDEDFDKTIRDCLRKDENRPSQVFEARLCAEAEGLLAKRRARHEDRLLTAKRSAELRGRVLLRLKARAARLNPAAWFPGGMGFLARHPALQVGVVLALITGLYLAERSPRGIPMTFADLPEFSKDNDAPARYDAQWAAERRAYEKESEEAHEQTSGKV